MSKPEPIPYETLDSDGRKLDLDLIGTFWRHNKSGNTYQIIGYTWNAVTDTWDYRYIRYKGNGTEYSRSIKNFTERAYGQFRFERIDPPADYKPPLDEFFHHLTPYNLIDGDLTIHDLLQKNRPQSPFNQQFLTEVFTGTRRAEPVLNTNSAVPQPKVDIDAVHEMFDHFKKLMTEAKEETEVDICGIRVAVKPSETHLGSVNLRLINSGPLGSEQYQKDMALISDYLLKNKIIAAQLLPDYLSPNYVPQYKDD